MRLKFSLLLLFLTWVHVLAAQDLSFRKRVDNVDSLLFYSDLEQADKEADRVYEELSKKSYGNKHRDLKLAVMLHKATISNLKGEYTEAIKIVLQVIDLAQEYGLRERAYKACLIAALVYEISGNYILCKVYLERADAIYRKGNVKYSYSNYCIRNSSYYRFIDKRDSALYFAYQGLHHANQGLQQADLGLQYIYSNRRDLLDAYIMLSILLDKLNYQESIRFAGIAAKAFLKRKDFSAVACMYSNICRSYQRQKEYSKAFLHNDTALWFSKKYALSNSDNASFLKNRYQLFEATGNMDSAYFYLNEYHNISLKALKEQEATEIQNVTERYQNDKKESLIKSKDQQLVFIIILLAVLAAAAVLLIRKNRKINVQNKLISKQVEELIKILEQKQVLLSELQHRVKNNLQQVISILEMQKESVDFNNIEEQIRGNQNRIHSMALVHKKLNVSENVDEVNLENYIIELSELVKNSYDTQGKKIGLNARCEIEKMSIEKALPIGLIIVELVSNSMKHGFRKQHMGTIDIALIKDEKTGKNIFYYADNGVGFDFNKHTETGLGMEIIKGLIGQLDATVESRYSNGFELKICF